MSLEQQIAELNENIKELISALKSGSPAAATQTAGKEAKPPKLEKNAPSSGNTKSSDESAAPSDSGDTIDYKTQVADPFVALYGKAPMKIKKLLSDFGVKALGEIPKERWPEVIAALAEIEASL